MTVPDTDRPHRGRAAEAFRALDHGGDLVKQRVWRRVEQGMREERERRRRRLGLIGGMAASSVAVLALVLPSALGTLRTWYEPSQQEEHRVAVSAVMEMLGQQQVRAAPDGSAAGLEDFVQYIVTEANTGAE